MSFCIVTAGVPEDYFHHVIKKATALHMINISMLFSIYARAYVCVLVCLLYCIFVCVQCEQTIWCVFVYMCMSITLVQSLLLGKYLFIYLFI